MAIDELTTGNKKPIAKLDQSIEVITNCDNPIVEEEPFSQSLPNLGIN